MEIAKGNVAERPFARTVYAVAAKRFTGDVVLNQNGKNYRVSWEGGRISAAESPSPSDQYIRLAIAERLLDTSLASEILNVQAQQAQRPQLEIIAEVGRLSPAQVTGLKRRGLAARAARQFALVQATFSVNNARSLSAEPDVPPLDPRWLIFFGVTTHYSVQRLEKESAPVLGKAVTISRDAYASIPAFGFGESDHPCIERLSKHAYTLPQLVSACPEIDRHRVLAIVYSLVACDCLAMGQATASPPAATAVQPAPPPPAKQDIAAGTVQSKQAAGERSSAVHRTQVPQGKPGAGAGSKPGSTNWDTRTRRKATITRNDLHQSAKGQKATRAVKLPGGFRAGQEITATEVRALIGKKSAAMDAGADYFALLDQSESASDADVHEAYFHLAKRLHPDRLRALKIFELELEAQRLFARINQAFAILTNPKKLREYREMLAAGGEEAIRRRQADAEQMAAKIFEAEELFRVGEAALRSSQFGKAMEQFAQAAKLNPEEGEHHASLAWATWCAAVDKESVVPDVKLLFSIAEEKSPRSAAVWMYRGLVAKQQGRTNEAEAAFRKVLSLDPRHRDAEAELRLFARREEATKSKSVKRGLFGKRR